MRFLLALGAGILTGLLLTSPSAAETTRTYRGLFGERTIGGPVTPQTRTLFDSAIRRGPSGSFLGIDRDQRFTRERPVLRSAIPDVPRSITTVPPAPPQQAAPIVTRPRVVPARPSPQPSLPPPPDTWFRTRGGRNR